MTTPDGRLRPRSAAALRRRDVGGRLGRDAATPRPSRSPAGAVAAAARTFAVHGHHYALVELDGLEPGTRTAVHRRDRRRAGLAADAGLAVPADPSSPPSSRASRCGWRSAPAARQSSPRRGGQPARTASTRCAPRRCAMAGQVEAAEPDDADLDPDWPDLVLFLGDQVYADETTDEMQEFIESRRDIDAGARGPSSRTTRSTPTSTGSRGPTRPTGGCSRRCRAR